MIKINDCLKYSKEKRLELNKLYIGDSDNIRLSGKVEFVVFGTILFNDIKLGAETYRMDIKDSIIVKIPKNSAIVITKNEKVRLKRPDFVPVEPVPEMEDSITALTRQMVVEMLEQHGFGQRESGDGSEAVQELDDLDQDIDDEDDDDFPIDTDSLVVVAIKPELEVEDKVSEVPEEEEIIIDEPDNNRDADEIQSA